MNRLFKNIYEDKTKGVLSENRFQMLANDYEQEQKEFELKIVSLSAEISKTEEQSDNLERFISKIHKYLNLQELTPTILNDMVKRVYVHAPETIDGKRTQQIDICYDLVGILPMSLLNKNNERGCKKTALKRQRFTLKVSLCFIFCLKFDFFTKMRKNKNTFRPTKKFLFLSVCLVYYWNDFMPRVMLFAFSNDIYVS